MNLYIDGDAFPNILKPIVYRAIERLEITSFIVSNKRVFVGNSKYIEYVIVADGPDEADNQIVKMVSEGDLVITADIPLADQVITKKAFALDPRGKFWDADNIKQALAMRDFMESFRESGGVTKGQAPFNQKDVSLFANQLNQFF
nr:YaiI/YqxD family protein [Melioribacteraceae bacterium]